MWTYEHSVETTATPEAIWRLWADIENWGAWNADIDEIETTGPLAVGAEFVMTPPGPDVRMRITEATEPGTFVDETRMDGLVLRTIHRIERLQPGARAGYRDAIPGPGAATDRPGK